MRALSRASRAASIATCLAGLFGVTCASLAHAQSDVDRATARTLGQDGQKALDAKDFKTAEDDFRRADSLVHAPTLLLGLARALAAEGKFVDAQETYKRIVREGVAPGAPAVFQKAVEDAGKEVQDVSPHIGDVTITVKAAGGGAVPNVQVTMDGAPVNAAALGVERPADPGSHVVHAAAAGFKPADVTVTVAAGSTVEAPLTLEVDPNAAAAPAGGAAPAAAGTPAGASPAPGAAPATPSEGGGGHGVLPWVAFGVGGAGLIVGAIAAGLRWAITPACRARAAAGRAVEPVVEPEQLPHDGARLDLGFIVAGVARGGRDAAAAARQERLAPPAAGLHVEPVAGWSDRPPRSRP